MKKIAIIPARGGSKRIPKKNIKSFLGKPIIAYSIEAALQSGLFDEVMVSTDNLKIGEIAKKYGASVPFFRTDKNSDDYATTIDVIEEVLMQYQNNDQNFDYACCIYPCAPFVTAQNLQKSYSKLLEQDLDCVFPIVKYGHPIQRALRIVNTGLIEMFETENMQLRSQDFEASYHDLGQFYFFKTNEILKQRQLWTDNTGFIELKESEAQDIDTIDDWNLAELKYKLLSE
jgi:N-acylneuraminate cytidylyltransferase